MSMGEVLRKILGRIDAQRDQLALMEVEVSGCLQALLAAEDLKPGECVHEQTVPINTGGGGPRKSLCLACNEPIIEADRPAAQEG